jgi:glycosyltransferase involved in cell wall biosynthesis
MTGASVVERLRTRFLKVAIVHDWLTIPGGSETVVFELLGMFPHAALYTSIYDPSSWPPLITERQVHVTFLDRIPGARRMYPKLVPLMGRAFESFDLSSYDLVISSSHANAKNVHTPPDTLHVCYCHTPMRYAWEPEFLDGEQIGAMVKWLLPPVLARMRSQDRLGASRPDVIVANSGHVASRIQRFYGRTSKVIHPPVDVEAFLTVPRRPQDYYLVLGRVVPYKRVDLALRAAALAGRPVKVAGDGRALGAVGGAATPNAELLGRVSNAKRSELLSGARALLFPGEEDFGIVPVEAQAAGVPVIAYGVGGACESVIDGRTGVLFDQQTPEAVSDAIARFESLQLDDEEIRANARRFSRARFQAEMGRVIEDAADGRQDGRHTRQPS